MSNTTSHDDITSGSDITAAYDLYGVNLILSGSQSASSAGFTGDVTISGSLNVTTNIAASSIAATGQVGITGSLLSTTISATTDARTPKVIVTAANTTACAFIVASSAAPGATDYAYPGSLWIKFAVSSVVGSTMGNQAWYMNTSASGAAGSNWNLMNALISS